MANVLPESEHKRIRALARSRFILVAASAMCACALIALLSFLPAYATVYFAQTDAVLAKAKPDNADQTDIARSQQLLRSLAPVATTTRTGIDAALQALQERPSGINVTSFSISPGVAGTIVMSGLTSSREAINAYASTLKSDARFKNVTVPLGAFAGASESRFTVTLTGNF